jgi:hypothetical protein
MSGHRPQLRVLSVLGTRPEAIKMAPVIRALESRPESFRSLLCVTGQHRDMLDQIMRVFKLVPDLPDLWADASMRCAVKRKSPSDERSAGNLHATFCGSRERATVPGHPVLWLQCRGLLSYWRYERSA